MLRAWMPSPFRPARAGAALLTLAAWAALCALPAGARAAEPDTYVRLYWSSWMTGQVQASPADPQGQMTDGATLTGNIKAELEAIFLQRVGLSFSRQKMERGYVDPGGACGAPPCFVTERALHESAN